jgi:hypothetical protein
MIACYKSAWPLNSAAACGGAPEFPGKRQKRSKFSLGRGQRKA